MGQCNIDVPDADLVTFRAMTKQRGESMRDVLLRAIRVYCAGASGHDVVDRQPARPPRGVGSSLASPRHVPPAPTNPVGLRFPKKS